MTSHGPWRREFVGQNQRNAKVVLVGDATVGKTHLLSRYIKGTLPKVAESGRQADTLKAVS